MAALIYGNPGKDTPVEHESKCQRNTAEFRANRELQLPNSLALRHYLAQRRLQTVAIDNNANSVISLDLGHLDGTISSRRTTGVYHRTNNERKL